MLENILTLLVDEVRELKKSNQDLHKEVVLLREKQQQTDQKVDRFANAVPRHHPMVMDISHPVLTSSFHKELYRMMPFLAHYHMKGSSFVIDDIRKPFVAMQVPDMATMRSWTTLPCGLGMPMIISANRVFCSVIQIPLHQLIGSPFSSVCRNETNRRLICRFAKNRGAAVSEVIDAVCTNRTPSGKMRNLKTRLQIFYGPDGQMKWIVSCFDAMVEQSGEHETKSITFPSPLLSCLTEGGTADDQPPPQHQQHEGDGLAGDSMDEGNGMALTEDAGRSGFFLSSSSSSSSSNSSSPSSSLSPLSFSSSSFFSLPSSPSSSLLPAGSTPPPIFASLVSSQPWHSPIPEGFFHEGPNCRFQQMDDEDSQDRVQEDCSSRPQDDEQPQQQQQQQQQPSQPDGYLQDMLFQLPSPSLLNPSPSPAMPFVVSPLSAQDDFSWLLSSPKPSPPPIRYQD